MKKNFKIIWDKLKSDPALAGVLAGGVLLLLSVGVFFWVNGVSRHLEQTEPAKETAGSSDDMETGFADMEQVVSDIEVSAAAKKRKLPIYCVETDKMQLALTFDAAWGNEYTEEILRILREQNVKATFFLTGQWLKDYPELVKKIYAEGHELGNHSLNHKEMSKLSKDEMKKEIMGIHTEIKDLTGCEASVFRPPYGDYNNDLIEVAEDCGYTSIQWSIDSLDWKDYGASAIVDTVTTHKNLSDGGIILMHNGAKYTADALENVITILKEKGYNFVTVSELIYKDSYEIDHSGKQYHISSDNLEDTEAE